MYLATYWRYSILCLPVAWQDFLYVRVDPNIGMHFSAFFRLIAKIKISGIWGNLSIPTPTWNVVRGYIFLKFGCNTAETSQAVLTNCFYSFFVFVGNWCTTYWNEEELNLWLPYSIIHHIYLLHITPSRQTLPTNLGIAKAWISACNRRPYRLRAKIFNWKIRPSNGIS